MTKYTFKEQHEKGKLAEAELDKYFSKYYEIVHIPLSVEIEHHYDRIFIRDGVKTKVEYKTDFQAHNTGNVFLETVSSGNKNTLGWLHTTKADELIYYIPQAKQMLSINMMNLRLCIIGLTKNKKVATCTNVMEDGSEYKSEGFLVPLKEIAKYGKLIKYV